ncbi:thiol:disulfide interchange protein DsbA/DsbL [Silanimonas sp.]|uniref:thiol:disulfide interchange protein DsbA/DsbL n=1 Tax=Silanimonas sp. TaxID=1929290 RepID=UPI001BC540D8|nr:thiol:disulfide interchange protein DsbA/DsbL [Silanimonas sp.]MBS3895266.1 thiol:disulfide interchange protein DsbA/DsbL [Silanimonas sp.]
MLRSLTLLAALLLPVAALAQGPAPTPRPGTDFVPISPAQTPFGPPGRIEVAEVFSYHCIHCADFQPLMSAWKARQPADVRVTYVHAAWGGAVDNLARGFYAAEALNAVDRTHAGMFRAFHVERRIRTGTPEEVADAYAALGLDRARLVATMNSFGVTSRVNRAKQFAQRTGVNATPTIVVNGRYRVSATPDRGFQGMLQTTEWLVARERARLRQATAAAPPAAPRPAAPAAR